MGSSFALLAVGVAGCSSSSSAGRPAASSGGSANDSGAAASGGSLNSTGGSHASGGMDASAGGGSELDAKTPDARFDGRSDSGSEAATASDAGPPGKALWQLFYDRSFAAHVAIDSKGGAIVSGDFTSDKDIHLGATTLVSKGSADIYLSRVVAGGSVDWARSYGAAAEDYPVSFVLDPTDRITLSGLYNGTGNIGGPDFPTFAGTPGRYDTFFAGLTAVGDYRWDTTINTTADSFPGGIALDREGDLFAVGYFMGTATIGGGMHTSTGSWDIYFARYDEPSGSLGSVLTFGGAGDDRAVAAVYTGTDVLVFGQFTGSVIFPTSPEPTPLTSTGGTDIFVARVTPAAVMTSVVSFGGAGDETMEAAHLDATGSVILAGEFDSPTLSILGGKNLATAGGNDFFVAKLDSELAHVWSERFGGDADDFVRDMAVGPDGTIAITGEFRDHLTFGSASHDAARSDAGGPSNIDILVAKLDADGAPLWSRTAGGPLPDRGLGVAMNAQGNVYATVSFQSPVDFGLEHVLTPDPGQWASALVEFTP